MVAEAVVPPVAVAVTVTVWLDVTEAGAVYNPAVEIDPTAGFKDQLTAVLEVNCCVCPAFKLAVRGATETATGTKVMVAEAVVPPVAVAVTVTVWLDVTEAGAVYNPAVEIDPTAGFNDQLTVELEVNCCVCPAFKLAVRGAIEAATGTRVMVAEAVVPPAAVAVTVTVWLDVTEAGAVYSPAVEIDPTAGFNDQLTVELEVNCCV